MLSMRTCARIAALGSIVLSACDSIAEQTETRTEPGASSAAEPAFTTTGTLGLRLEHVGSSSLALAWDAAAGAEAVEVLVGPEPAATAGAELPGAVLEATLDGEATAVAIDGIAAGTDLFVRVQAREGGAVRDWADARVRLAGGPRAALETPLREVHGHGPRTLMLVLANPGVIHTGSGAKGDTGRDWQGGTWQVERAGGRRIEVKSVARHSLPVSQPDYPVGYERYGNGNVLDVDHRIYLELAEPVGERELLRLVHEGAGETALDVRVPFSDRYLETPLIQVNQVGYNPRATRRWAYVYGWEGTGGAAELGELPAEAEVLAAGSDPLAPRNVVHAGLAVTERRTHCGFAAGEVREIDLAEVTPREQTRLYVRIPGVGVSFPTAISEAAAAKAFHVVWRGLFHNRWCGDLDAAHTEWSRPADHCQAYFVRTGKTGTQGMFGADTPRREEDLRPLRGGHHDAGDFDIRPYHVVVAQYLLRAFELDPARFSDGQLDIPESGNGIPDVLDEALWSIAAWEQLQADDGGVASGVESFKHPAGVHFADDDGLPYWTYDPVGWHTAYTAALMAQAAYLVRPFAASRAAALEDRARAAYEWASAQGAPDSYLLYAAGELFRLTGDESYARQFETLWDALGRNGRGAFDNMLEASKIYPGAFTRHTPAMADFVMGYLGASAPDADIEALTLAQLTERADRMRDRILDAPYGHRHGRPAESAPDWGVDVGTGRDGDAIYQRLQLGGLSPEQAQDYFDALSLSADYVLGCNPAGYSFITGLGTRSPREPLHLDSLSFIKARGMPPVPGIPTYGVVNGFPGSGYYQPIGAMYAPAFNAQPPGLRLTDTRTAVNMNEFSVWEMQAPLAELFGALLGDGHTPPASWGAGGSEHRSPLAPVR